MFDELPDHRGLLDIRGYQTVTVAGNLRKMMRKTMNAAFSIPNLMARSPIIYGNYGPSSLFATSARPDYWFGIFTTLAPAAIMMGLHASHQVHLASLLTLSKRRFGDTRIWTGCEESHKSPCADARSCKRVTDLQALQQSYISDARHAQGIFEVVHLHQSLEGVAIFQSIPLFKYEAIQSWLLAGHVQGRFVDTLTIHLKAPLGTIPRPVSPVFQGLKDKAPGRIADVLRLTFLDLNHHDALRAGAGGLVACVVDTTLYAANIGRDMMMMSTDGETVIVWYIRPRR
ncbi:hypothetical protein BD779DRAFT_1678422 [Infundibulicybe gibba]|nr:hypothetical protein BD779DRAFT_1678422 [Infundibulicybe gibba]